MITFTGRRFFPFDPRPAEVSFRDIGHALSLICRYGGHVKRFYSVAEHSALLALYFDRMIGRQDLARYALLHDGPEAYVGDMIRPLKRDMPRFREIEEKIERAIFHAAGLPGQIPKEVHDADTAILGDEANTLFRPETLRAADWRPWEMASLGVFIEGCQPHDAEQLFARVFKRLFPEVAWV